MLFSLCILFKCSYGKKMYSFFYRMELEINRLKFFIGQLQMRTSKKGSSSREFSTEKLQCSSSSSASESGSGGSQGLKTKKTQAKVYIYVCFNKKSDLIWWLIQTTLYKLWSFLIQSMVWLPCTLLLFSVSCNLQHLRAQWSFLFLNPSIKTLNFTELLSRLFPQNWINSKHIDKVSMLSSCRMWAVKTLLNFFAKTLNIFFTYFQDFSNYKPKHTSTKKSRSSVVNIKQWLSSFRRTKSYNNR